MVKEIQEFWENIADDDFAHLSTKGGIALENGSPVLLVYEQEFLNDVDWKNKIVIDYGIGRGWLGKYLFENREIKDYIGFDVSRKALKQAQENIGKGKFVLVDDFVSFQEYGADIFVSLACIQHFPYQKLLDGFLAELNKSEIPVLVIQIRYSETTEFSGGTETKGAFTFGCKTNAEYLKKALWRYELQKAGEVHKKTNYQYLIFRGKAL